MHVSKYVMAVIITAFLPTVAVYAQSEILVEVEMDEYSLGDNIVFLLTVPDVLNNELATLTFSHDLHDPDSVEILVENLTSMYISPNVIDSFYSPGTWTLQIEYGNMSANDVFTILDSDMILLPSWFKDIATLWQSEVIQDVDYGEYLSLLYYTKILDYPIPEEVKNATFPDWFKNLATMWWIEGYIDDSSYVNIINYLLPEIIVLE